MRKEKTMTQTIPEQPARPVQEYREQLAIQGDHLAEKVRELVHEGNVRRLIIKHEGHTVVEIPVTWGVIGTILSPTLAAVGAIGMMVSNCTLEIIRVEPEEPA